VAVLREGILQQVDTPQQLFRHPANLFVAAFVGSPPMNLAEATVRGSSIALGDSPLPLDPGTDLSAYEGRTVIVGIRPTDLEDARVHGEDGAPAIEVVVDIAEELGSEVNLLFEVDAPPVKTEETLAAATESEEEVLPLEADRAQFCARVDARSTARPGERVRLTVDPSRFHFFDPGTGRAIDGRPRVGATA
jgi:multiple sugar transport system ATP-binding protein